jgi:hypothetical protein
LAVDDWLSIVNPQSALDSDIHDSQSGNEDPDPRPIPSPSPSPDPAPTLTRTTALLEVLLCSGFPTQIVVFVLLQSLGLVALDSQGRLSIVFVMVQSLADALRLVGLVLVFLRAHREGVREVLVPPGARLRSGCC